jgi:hypothetical protein
MMIFMAALEFRRDRWQIRWTARPERFPALPISANPKLSRFSRQVRATASLHDFNTLCQHPLATAPMPETRTGRFAPNRSWNVL